MTGAARNLDQADMDLQRAIDLFDTALTSKDERVVNALRSLMMIVALTDPETVELDKVRVGPLRAMERDIDNMHSRIRSLEDNLSHITGVLSRGGVDARKHEYTRWPRDSVWSTTSASDTFYINDYIKRMNGGSI